MYEELLFKTIVSVVPQWYTASHGPNRKLLKLGNSSIGFCSPRPLPIVLQRLLGFAQEHVEHWLELINTFPEAVELIQERLALKWLMFHGSDISWQDLLDYFRTLRYRTYENEQVNLNLVVGEGNGSLQVTSPALQKLLDPLATSLHVFLRVDKSLRFLDYQEISWSEIDETREYKFHPEFLQPFASTLKPGEFSVHQTHAGDLIIMNHIGLLASKRKGRWHLYDVPTFRNCIAEVLGQPIHGQISTGHSLKALHDRVGTNLFEIVFDLSYKRHGALLIYDPSSEIIPRITNRKSILGTGTLEAPDVHQIIGSVVRQIQMGHERRVARKKRLFLELASMDGALIFDQQKILAFGAMIEPHPDVGSHPGARTTAAHSAFSWGGLPVKISSDGDILIMFRSEDRRGHCPASLEFL